MVPIYRSIHPWKLCIRIYLSKYPHFLSKISLPLPFVPRCAIKLPPRCRTKCFDGDKQKIWIFWRTDLTLRYLILLNTGRENIPFKSALKYKYNLTNTKGNVKICVILIKNEVVIKIAYHYCKGEYDIIISILGNGANVRITKITLKWWIAICIPALIVFHWFPNAPLHVLNVAHLWESKNVYLKHFLKMIWIKITSPKNKK